MAIRIESRATERLASTEVLAVESITSQKRGLASSGHELRCAYRRRLPSRRFQELRFPR